MIVGHRMRKNAVVPERDEFAVVFAGFIHQPLAVGKRLFLRQLHVVRQAHRGVHHNQRMLFNAERTHSYWVKQGDRMAHPEAKPGDIRAPERRVPVDSRLRQIPPIFNLSPRNLMFHRKQENEKRSSFDFLPACTIERFIHLNKSSGIVTPRIRSEGCCLSARPHFPQVIRMPIHVK